MSEVPVELSRPRIATHEAGHTVLAVVLGRPVHSVRINAESEPLAGGTTVVDPRLDVIYASTRELSAEDRDYLVQEIDIAWAGIVAEVMEYGGHYALNFSDLGRINRALKRLGWTISARDRLPEVISILRKNEELVGRLRDALLAEAELSAERVRELVR